MSQTRSEDSNDGAALTPRAADGPALPEGNPSAGEVVDVEFDELDELWEADPDFVLLEHYFAGELDDESREMVERRLASDAAFSERAAPFRAMIAGVEWKRERAIEAAKDGPAPLPVVAGRRPAWMGRAVRTIGVVSYSAALLWGGFKLAPFQDVLSALVVTDMIGNDGGRFNYYAGKFNNHIEIVRLDPDTRLSFRDGVNFLPALGAPGPHDMTLDGGGEFEITLPESAEMKLRTPFVNLRMTQARIIVTYEEPCNTTVRVSRGSLTLTPRRQTNSLRMTAGMALRVGCDKSIRLIQDESLGPVAPAPGSAGGGR